METATTTAKIYVGTFAKYNNGSIEGAWLTLSDYSDAEEFLTACAELHSDEVDAELMFQDYEGFPKDLYSESMSESELEKVYEYMEVMDQIEGWDDSDWISAHNTYCIENNNSDDEIFGFDDDFFNTYFEGRPMEAARATHFGEVNWNDDYITFNGYGNLKSFSNPDNYIDKDAIIADIIENPRNYNL